MPLGEVITLQRGYDLPAEQRRPGKYPVISSAGVFATHYEPGATGPGVLTGRYGTVGQVHYVEGDYWPLNTTLFVRDFKGNHPRFVAYLLKTLNFGAHSDKSSVPGVNRNHLHQEIVRLPPLRDQRAIASILGAIDDKIDLNRRMNETLDSVIDALYESVVATTGSEGPDRRSIYELASVKYGAPFSSRLFNSAGDGLPLIRIRDLATHSPDVFTLEVLDRATVVEPGDVVVGMDGEFRVHHWRGQRAWLNQRVCLFAPTTGVPRTYLSRVLREPLMQFERGKTGTTVIHLGKSDIDTFRVPLPAAERLASFGEATEPMLKRILLNEHEARTLTVLRDTLLPKLISGELRIKDSERLAEAAERG